ncbi:DUF1987 domain-containing protein [Thiorhodococcus fuscus]|uniref:DUF1987 domain-containing protein n=1 Tax=Thiorhodococcus fuscus TaxID=527200 RepID=A0ABW4Y8R1_9GAMM
MDIFSRPQTERSPLIDFDFANRRLRIEGESYPEDAASFFGPMFKSLEGFLADVSDETRSAPISVDLRLSYFNSSSAKALMNLFQMLEETARGGVPVEICWNYEADDETMQEFGEDFGEDMEYARFNLRVLDTDVS